LAVAVILGAAACSSGGASSDTAQPAGIDDTATRAVTSTTVPPLAPVTVTPLGWHLDAAMSRLVCVADGSEVRCAGGLSAKQQSMGQVFRLDPATGKSTAAGNLPSPLHDAAAATVGGHSLVIGGGHGETGIADVVDFGASPSKRVGSMPQPRSDVSAVTIGDRLFVVGGYDGKNSTPDVLESDDGGKTFRTIASLRTPVRYAPIAASDGAIYVFGGKTRVGGADSQTADIQRIDLNAGTVSVVGQFPTPIGHMVEATLGDHVYLIGGRVGTTNTTVAADIWRFDPTTSSVVLVGRLPEPLTDTTAVTVGDRILVLGGERPTPTPAVIEIRQP
jgi:hypothetical protein